MIATAKTSCDLHLKEAPKTTALYIIFKYIHGQLEVSHVCWHTSNSS